MADKLPLVTRFISLLDIKTSAPATKLSCIKNKYIQSPPPFTQLHLRSSLNHSRSESTKDKKNHSRSANPASELPITDKLPLVRRFATLFDTKTSAPATKLINNLSVSTSDIQIDPSQGLWFRLFTPSITSDMKLPLIVYFHGGGFSRCAPDTKIYDDLCSHLAAKVPAVIASVSYGLAPEYKCPSQYDDGYNALKFIDAQNSAILPTYTDLTSCFIGGDSAGGNIAHHVTVRALKNADQFNKIRITGLLALQPAFGGEERTESQLRFGNVERIDKLWRDFLPEGADRNHPAVNVFGGGSNSEAAKEIKNLEFPPALVVVGGKDALQDWNIRYVEWLNNCGKEVELALYPDATHAFYGFPEVPEFDLLFQRLKEFIHKHVHSN